MLDGEGGRECMLSVREERRNGYRGEEEEKRRRVLAGREGTNIEFYRLKEVSKI